MYLFPLIPINQSSTVCPRTRVQIINDIWGYKGSRNGFIIAHFQALDSNA